MASTSKVSFRARALDSTKPMGVFYAAELPDLSECTPIARSVMQMPTGMEKDEEMESHLQDAILAQQASTSGIRVENHVIPTPKVTAIDEGRYNRTYPKQEQPQKDQYIRVQAWVSFDQEEPDYDIDSEDDEWLKERQHIDPRSFEKIFDALEAQSTGHICTPEDVKGLIPQQTEDFLGEVYDYWIAKRTHAAKNIKNFASGIGGLIPKIRTDSRKDATGINPYVAFRRRAEKMQTRKHRKNDEDAYEKVLKITHDLSKAHMLVDSIRRREKTKAALIDYDQEIFAKRLQLSDFGSNIYNQLVSKMRIGDKSKAADGQAISSKVEADAPKKKKKVVRPRGVRPTTLDREIPTSAWMKEMNKVWNKPPQMGGVSAVTEVDRHVQASQDAHQDGRYTFKRRRGCTYRAPIIPTRDVAERDIHRETFKPERRFFPVELPDVNGEFRTAIPLRRRIGRGGRIIYDRLSISENERVPKILDPFMDDVIEDHTVTYRSKPVFWALPCVERRIPTDDAERERRWLASSIPTTSGSAEDTRSSTGDEKKNINENSGNGQPGRVTDPTDRSKDVSTEDWREEASGSPTESNSSTEWTPPSLGTRAYALLPGEDDARTGDHPLATHPQVKESIMTGCVLGLEIGVTPYILPPASVIHQSL